MPNQSTTTVLRKRPNDAAANPPGEIKTRRRQWFKQLGKHLTSPLGILLSLPVFACSIGIVMAWQGHLALQTVIDSIALDSFFTQSKHAARRTQQILSQGPSLTKRWHRFLRKHNGNPPMNLMAQTIVDLMSHREGIAWMSYGRDDGKFWGVFRNLKGHFIFTRRFVHPKGHNDLKDFRVTPGGMTLLRHKPKYKYDHRIRKWYKLALKHKGAVWTKPYTFFTTGIAGISCVKQLKIGGVNGVTTVDYSLNSLSAFVERLNASQQGSAFIFTKDSYLLAYPGGRHAMMRLDGKGLVGLPKASRHSDPILRAFFQTPEFKSVGNNKPSQFEFVHNKQRIFGSIMPSAIDTKLTWYVGAFIPRAKLVAPVKQHKRDAIEIALLTLLLSLQLAALLSWRVWRSRRALLKANEATKQAKKEAYELGSYTMTKLIGGGGMGEVWEAKHQMLARPAAIKLIRSDIMNSGQHDPELILRHFEREAKATARLSSPHTVRLYDYGTSDDGHFFYVMELLQGLDLRQLIQAEGPQRVGRVVHVMRQVVLSLAEAHKNGLVHRDLKPANVFLCAQGTQLDFVKVLDFGVVHVDTEGEAEQGAVGTPSIMAPEQIKSNKLDGRTDLYAVGCLAYWMLTGENVFGNDSVTKVLERHLRQPPPSAKLKCPFPIPDELDELLQGCLAKDPQHRPANAETLMRMLDAIPIPLSQIWNDEAIQAWWSTHFPALSVVKWHAHALEERLLTTPVPAEHPTMKTPPPGGPNGTKRLSVSPSDFAALAQSVALDDEDWDPDDSLITRADEGIHVKTLHKTALLKKR